MATRPLKLPIKCSIIAGHLNSGKTSLILHLLRQKPADEVWSILVNETGAVGLDQAILSSSQPINDGTIAIRELGGGCLCCVMGTVTATAIVQLIRKSKPDRLIIEPSGLAHPKALLEMLQSEYLKNILKIEPIVCLMDLAEFHSSSKFQEEEGDDENLHRATVFIADILVGTKADICSEERIIEFKSWAEKLKPRKKKVVAIKNSEINMNGIFSIERNSLNEPTAEDVFESLSLKSGVALGARGGGQKKKFWLTNEEPLPSKKQPIRKISTLEIEKQVNAATCGWIFHPDDVFSATAIQEFAETVQPHIMRLKGLLRIEHSPPKWALLSIGGGTEEDVSLKELPNVSRQEEDSRIEIIVGLKDNSNTIETHSDLAKAVVARDWDLIEDILIHRCLTSD